MKLVPVAIVGAAAALLVACGNSSSHAPDAPPTPDASPDGSPPPPLAVLGQPDVMHDLNVELGLYYPGQISFGGGRLVVADGGNSRVLVWSSLPTAPATPPDLVLGRTDPNFGISSVRPPTATTTNGPDGVWTDGTRLLVADTINNRVLVWSTFPTTDAQPADFALGQPAGAANLTSNTANNGGVSASSMDGPLEVTSDGTALYVADYNNNRVLVWSTFPTAPTAASFALGQPSGATNLTTNTANNGGVTGAAMSGPTGVAVVGTQLFVTDFGNNRVLAWNGVPTAPTAASFALGQLTLTTNTANRFGLSVASMQFPSSVTAGNGQLFVSDQGNNRVLVWNAVPSMTQPASFVLGQPNATSNTGNNGGVSGSSMFGPTGAVVAGGELVVADQNNDRLVVWNQVPSSLAAGDYAIGSPAGATNLTDNGHNHGAPVSGQTMKQAAAIYSDGTQLYAVDLFNSRVLVWTSMPTADGQPADFALGQAAGPNNLTADVQGQNGGASGMNYPSGGVLVQNGSLFVADTNNSRVLVWRTVPTAAQPADFALGQPAGATNLTSTTANNGGVSGGSMIEPTGLWGDGTRLFVADSYNNRVLVWNTTPTAPVPADFALGQPADATNLTSNTANTGGPSGSGMSYPSSVFGMAGALYVADLSNNRVLVWSTTPTSPQPASFALGQPDLMTVSAATTQAGMKQPIAIAGDGTRLYVADSNNNRVLVWSSPPTSSQPATDVIGQTDFTHGDAYPLPALGLTTFNYPAGLFADGHRLFVADESNDRVVVIPQ